MGREDPGVDHAAGGGRGHCEGYRRPRAERPRPAAREAVQAVALGSRRAHPVRGGVVLDDDRRAMGGVGSMRRDAAAPDDEHNERRGDRRMGPEPREYGRRFQATGRGSALSSAQPAIDRGGCHTPDTLQKGMVLQPFGPGRLDGAALDMGTPFDFFGEESRCGFVTSSRSLPEAEPGIP